MTVVSLGTPHYSLAEFAELMEDLDGAPFRVGVWVNTNRAAVAELETRGWRARLEAAGVRLIVDACAYATRILPYDGGALMTNSGKCAYYAPGNLGMSVAYGSLDECLASARAGTGGAAVISGVCLVPGESEGAPLILAEPLSFWGGFDPGTGTIIDRWHPQAGASIAGRVLMMPGGRGSCSGSAVLAEAVRLGNGPAAILLSRRDPIVIVGAIVAAELYGPPAPSHWWRTSGLSRAWGGCGCAGKATPRRFASCHSLNRSAGQHFVRQRARPAFLNSRRRHNSSIWRRERRDVARFSPNSTAINGSLDDRMTNPFSPRSPASASRRRRSG